MSQLTKKDSLLLGESDFEWNVDHEDVDKEVRIKKEVGGHYGEMEGTIKDLYRSESDMPVDAYWVCFEDYKDDLWFLPNELEFIN